MKNRGLCSVLLALAVLTLWASASLASSMSLSATHQLNIVVTPLDGGPAPIWSFASGGLDSSGCAAADV